MFAIIKRIIFLVRTRLMNLLGRTTSVVGDKGFENGLIEAVNEGRFNRVSFKEFIGEKSDKSEKENVINNVFVPLIKERLKDKSSYAVYSMDLDD